MAPTVEMTGVSPSSSRRWISSARTCVTLPTKPSAGSRRRDRQQPGVLARHADRDRLVAGLAVDRRDEVAVDLADQHHADDLERLGVGDAKAVLELRLLADAAKHRVDLRPAAMDEHAAHADAAQQQHVLRQREVGLAVDRRAAELHDDRLAGELADVGQRLDEDVRDLGRRRTSFMTSCYSL